MKKYVVVLLAMVGAAVIMTGCGKEKTAGEKLDSATTTVQKKADQAGKDINQAANDAGKAVGKAANQAGDDLKKAGDNLSK